MPLADMMARFPDELTCDMAETYGIFDIKRVPARLLATLAVGLRDDSRVKRAITGAKADDKTVILAYIADCVRWLQWAQTKDGVDGINYPSSLLDFYTHTEERKEEPEYELFDSLEDFKARWKGITGN